jgi:hypothetical protein
MNSNYATKLDGQNENTVYLTRSYMYEFIILFVISVIVLTITIRNLTSDAVTAGGYTICCIILILFVISAVMYIGNLFGSQPFSSANSANSAFSSANSANSAFGSANSANSANSVFGSAFGSGSNEGPVIRIRYV